MKIHRPSKDDVPYSHIPSAEMGPGDAFGSHGAFGRRPSERLSCRLRRILTDNPRARSFSVNQIVNALGGDSTASPLAFFSAAGVFHAPGAHELSGVVTSAVGAGLALGRRSIPLPPAVLRRKIPRNSLALLIHGIGLSMDGANAAIRQRWSWVFHPAMSGVLGLTLFLIGLTSMAPIIGGGVQYAASAFVMAIGMAERDGLVVMIGAVAGIAAIAVAALSVSTGRRLWQTIKAWLLKWAQTLRLHALAALLDRCCAGLGELIRMRWTELLLFVISPGDHDESHAGLGRSDKTQLRDRARRVARASLRDYFRITVTEHGS